MNQDSIVTALAALGYVDGYATCGGVFTIWEHDNEPPTEAELIAAGWVKPEPAEEAPTE